MSDIEPIETYPPAGDGDGSGTTVVRKRSSGTLVAAVLGAMALIFGSLALIRAVNAPNGATSAEDAVKNLLDAIASEDVIGVLQALDPSERDTLKGPIEDIAGELQRLGILADGFDLRAIAGLGLDFTDVELSSTTLADGFVAVSIDGGTFNAAVIPADLPLGPFFDDFFEQTGEDPRDEDPTEETTPLTEMAEFDIVAVERDGGWFVSLWYSVAEAARQDAGLDPPAFGRGLTPDGADSPELAVREMIDAGIALDVRKVFALLPPGEASALHDYAPLFLDDLEADIAEMREEEDFSVEVTGLELETDESGDRARVAIAAFDLEATFADGSLRVGYGDGAFDVEWSAVDGGERGSVSYDGECFRSEGESYGESYDDEACRGDEDFPPLPEDLSEIVPAITAVRVGGSWFLSPTRTVLDSVVQVLEMIDEDDLEGFFDGRYGLGFASLLYLPFYMGAGYSSSESFSEVGESIEISPEQEACYDAEAELTEEEWEQGVVLPECEGLSGWSDFPAPPTTSSITEHGCFQERLTPTTVPGAKPQLQACLDE